MGYRIGLICAVLILIAASAHGQLAVTANDAHWTLIDGVQQAVKSPEPDSISIIDLSASPPKLVADIDNVPNSVIGPPLSVAVAPDESIALVTACMKLTGDPMKQTENNLLSVIDLKSSPPRLIVTLNTGKGPAGVSINHAGTLALVANRGDGSVSIFTIKGKTVASAGTLAVADAVAALAHVVFTTDGKHALLTRDGDNTISILDIDGETVKLSGRDIRTGLRPYPIDVTADGAIAICANVGGGSGDMDTISVIDLRAQPPRVVDVIPVGLTPEALKISADGKWCAIGVHNGSNLPKNSPFYNDHGSLVLFRIDGTKVTKVAQAPVGHWVEGVAFSKDGKTIAVANNVEKEIQILRWDGTNLGDTGQRIRMKHGPAAIRTAE